MMTRRTIILAAGYATVAGICTLIPLLNAFGFEYAFLFGLLSTCTAGPFAISLIRPAYQSGGPARRAFLQALRVNLLMLLLPLLVMFGAAVGGMVCSLPEGLGFFFLLPVVTAIVATSLAYFCTVHYRRAHLFYWLLVGATVAYTIALGYFSPAIYSYNLFYGFFPGITYDELLPLTWTLVLFRVLTLGVAALLVWMALVLEGASSPGDRVQVKGVALLRALVRPPRLYVSLVAAATVALIYFFRCEMGFETTESHLRRALGAQYRTEHFVISYVPESCDTGMVRRIGREHEYQLSRLMDLFSLTSIEPINSYLYPSNDLKQRLIGAGSTSIAKPWNRQLHISLPSLDAVLGHEMVHVVAGRFGEPVIRANLSTGLTEGLAMAAEGPRGERTAHQYAAAMRKAGIAPDITSLMSFTGFAAQSSSVSYVLAGSFCRYLIDRYGIRRIVQVYGGTGYSSVYGRSLGELVAEWQGFLDRIEVRPADSAVVDAFFRRPAMFAKTCPRVVARRIREAGEAFAHKQYSTAASTYRSILAETGAYESLSGFLVSAYRLRQFDTVIAVYRNRVLTDPRPARYLSLFILFGDAHWGMGDTSTALSLYRQLASANLTAGLTEQALVRIGALTETNPSLYFAYLTSDVPDSVRAEMADSLFHSTQESPLALFLRGRAAQRMERFEEALASYRDVDDRRFGHPLQATRLWAAGECLFRLERYQDAKVPFWESLNPLPTEARQELAADWTARCDWMSRSRNH